jgi:hypothetical protein
MISLHNITVPEQWRGPQILSITEVTDGENKNGNQTKGCVINHRFSNTGTIILEGIYGKFKRTF